MYVPQPLSVYPVALAVAGVVVIGLGWASAYDPEPLWAPGELSRNHAGQVTCTQCHQPFRGATTAKCLGCHATTVMAGSNAMTQAPSSDPHAAFRREGGSCLTCHTEHQGVSAPLTYGPIPAATPPNPHSDFIFRVTGTQSCLDCHAGKDKPKYGLLDNAAVRGLIAKGKGAHGPGRFADCFRCHAGGRVGPDRNP
jgi:hypothetical protein